eukprot:520901-Pelagomonas_calceolata.AAC.1
MPQGAAMIVDVRKRLQNCRTNLSCCLKAAVLNHCSWVKAQDVCLRTCHAPGKNVAMINIKQHFCLCCHQHCLMGRMCYLFRE